MFVVRLIADSTVVISDPPFAKYPACPLNIQVPGGSVIEVTVFAVALLIEVPEERSTLAFIGVKFLAQGKSEILEGLLAHVPAVVCVCKIIPQNLIATLERAVVEYKTVAESEAVSNIVVDCKIPSSQQSVPDIASSIVPELSKA